MDEPEVVDASFLATLLTTFGENIALLAADLQGRYGLPIDEAAINAIDVMASERPELKLVSNYFRGNYDSTFDPIVRATAWETLLARIAYASRTNSPRNASTSQESHDYSLQQGCFYTAPGEAIIYPSPIFGVPDRLPDLGHPNLLIYVGPSAAASLALRKIVKGRGMSCDRELTGCIYIRESMFKIKGQVTTWFKTENVAELGGTITLIGLFGSKPETLNKVKAFIESDPSTFAGSL